MLLDKTRIYSGSAFMHEQGLLVMNCIDIEMESRICTTLLHPVYNK